MLELTAKCPVCDKLMPEGNKYCSVDCWKKENGESNEKVKT